MRMKDWLDRRPCAVSFGRRGGGFTALQRDAQAVFLISDSGDTVEIPTAGDGLAGVLDAPGRAKMDLLVTAGSGRASAATAGTAGGLEVPATIGRLDLGGVGLHPVAYRRAPAEPAHALKLRTMDRHLPDGSTDAANGGWWEIVEDPQGVNVVAAGADPSGVADSTAAFAAALAVSGRIYGPAGTYRLRGLNLDGTRRKLSFADARLVNDFGDGAPMFVMAASASFLDSAIEAESLTCTSGAGAMFDVRGVVSRLGVTVRNIIQNSNAATITNASAPATAQMFHATWRVQFWDAAASNTVSVIDWSGPGNRFNANRFDVRRCDGVSVPWARIETTDTNRFKGLVFEGFQLELCDHGWLRLGGCAHVAIRDVVSFDNGTIDAPLVEIADSPGGATPVNLSVNGLFRAGGVLAGTSDILISAASARGVAIERCGAETAASGFRIDLGNNTRTSLRELTFATVVNDPSGGNLRLNHRDWDTSLSGIKTPALVVPHGTLASDRQVIANGTIAYDGRSGIIIDTEGNAATDDLDTIDVTNAPNGTLVFLGTFVDTRDVVVKHNTGNIVLKAGSDTTLASRSQLVTLRYNAGVARWIEV
ncbi:hypothetical protein M1105_17725 [Limibaculum sp. FT325]|uniref:glycosyl hydrolase family 28-related protein n=1 Tax=Thermohalobaculum sediminis TaxID=2939436 RepID=UPI0020BE109D|nr:glycosyl hydrolase family 28-related protein [Limibaculum sediminis]MCL5778819.1 hypothetical protein [Limibaculum sediminis]